MNRETKRMMQRQGQVEAEGSPAVADVAEHAATPAKSSPSLPSRIAEFFREIRSEMRQVAWPTRPEVISSSTVVLIALVVLVAFIFLLNFAFSHGITFLFQS